MNAPIQGTQADIIKLAMVRADELIEKKGWRERVGLLLQVHDELVYEVDDALVDEAGAAIKEVMESALPKGVLGGVPIVAELAKGVNWAEMEK